jgi:endonuclease YncB( thermonuclease family)
MFGKRNSSEGFEWHKYVRTTIKLKREQRRQRIVDARHAAIAQAGQAGVALAAGSRAAGSAALEGARAGLGVAGLALQALWNLLATVSAIAWHHFTILMQPVIVRLQQPNIGGPMALAAAIALGLGIGRFRGTGFDQEAKVATAIGVILLIAALPFLVNATGIRLPRMPALGGVPRAGLIAAGVVAAGAVLAWMAGGGRTGLASLSSSLPLVGGPSSLQGRADVIGGDLMRVGGTTVRLAGIEVPERQQTCGTGNKRYRCGAAAHAALSKLVAGRSVTCKPSGTDSSGHALASCTRGDLDISGELVRQGQAFAAGGIFASYAALERQARDAKAGMWAAGEVERPSDFRAKAWDEAKRRAPDGCPIKGIISGGARVYVLPWAPDYDRERIQKGRGERWFCSEREAEAAGFKPSVRG